MTTILHGIFSVSKNMNIAETRLCSSLRAYELNVKNGGQCLTGVFTIFLSLEVYNLC
jgi:hypothetical protein